MCKNGVNNNQMRLMLGQTDDSLAMTQQWLEQIHHLADHAELAGPSTEVAQASVLLGEVREKLQRAADLLGGSTGSEAKVELV